MKQSLIFVLIAVLSAGLVLTGCSSDSDSGSSGTASDTIDGIVIDATVANEAGLKAALLNDRIEVVALVLSADTSLTEVTVIPYGKTLVLLNTAGDRHSLTPTTSGLNIRGSVIVSENTELTVTETRPVSLWSDGNIQVQARGLLTTDKRSTVSNWTDAGVGQESVLLKNVRYGGGSTLRVTGEGNVFTIDAINALLAGLTPGTRAVNAPTGPSRLDLTDKLTLIKPSDVAQLAGTSDTRRVSLEPDAIETAADITIPAGAEVTIAQDLPTVRTLVVGGSLSAPSIGGAEATAAVKVTVNGGGTLSVATPITFAAESTIASGGAFNGTPSSVSASQPTMSPGAVINGTPVKTDPGVVAVINAAGLTGLEAGKTYQIVGSVSAETVAVIADATLLIPEGATLTLTGAGITGAGTVIVEAGGSATGMPKLSTQKVSETDLNPASADFTVSSTKNLATGRLDVKLYGTVNGETEFAEVIKTNLWGAAGAARPAGNWSWVTFDNLLPALDANFVIRQTNQAFRYYKADAGTAVGADLEEPSTSAGGSIYVSADNTVAYKWRKYESSVLATEWWGILLWSGASTTALEVTPASGTGFTVTLDWSGLRINAPE
jgi:hypothetical protein